MDRFVDNTEIVAKLFFDQSLHTYHVMDIDKLLLQIEAQFLGYNVHLGFKLQGSLYKKKSS